MVYFSLNTEIHGYLTISRNNLHLTRVNTSYGSKCLKLKYKVSQLWNALPTDLKRTANACTFKRKLKNYLIHCAN